MPHSIRVSQITDGTKRNAITSEIQRRRDLFQDRDNMMHQIRRMRLMRHKVYVPKAYQARLGGERAPKMPIMYRLVQTAVSAVNKHPPKILNTPRDARDRRAAEELDRADALLLQSVESQSNTPFLENFFYNLFGDGLVVTKSQFGPWGGFPIPEEGTFDTKEGRAEYNELAHAYMHEYPLPFYASLTDPLVFYPPVNQYGDGLHIESGMRSTREVLRGLRVFPGTNRTLKVIPEDQPYPMDELPPGTPPFVRVDEVWSDDKCAVVVHGTAKGGSDGNIFVFENPLGESPYVWGFADPTGVMDPTNVGMSVAFPLFYIAPWIDTEMAIMMAWSLFAAPTPYTTQDPNPNVKSTQETTIETYEPGKMYHFPTGRKVGVLSPPPVGDSITQFLQVLFSAADAAGLPPIVSGGGAGSRLPALTFQSAKEAGTDRLGAGIRSAERALGGTIRKWHKLVGRYDQDIKVNGWEYLIGGERDTRSWATLKASEARKNRPVVVSLSVDSTQDRIAKGTHAQFMVNAKLWDRETAQRFEGTNNPQEVDDKIAGDVAWEATLPIIAQSIIESDPDLAAAIQQGQEAPENGSSGPGRNREGVPAGRGGGARSVPTQRPRGNRPSAPTFGRT